MLDINIVYIVAVITIAITTLTIGYKWVTHRELDPKVTKKRINWYQEYIDDLEDDVKHYKGIISNNKRTPQITADISNLDDADGIKAIIGELLPKISPMLPKPLQALAHDPKAVDFAIDLYKKDPERAKSLLAGFIKKGKDGKSETGLTSDSKTDIPAFGEGGIL